MSQNTQIIIVAAVAVAVIAAGLGGAYAMGIIGGSSDPVDRVPHDDTTAVVSFDGEVLTDDTSRTVLDAMLEADAQTDDDPQSVDELMETFTGEVGLEINNFDNGVMFVQESDNQGQVVEETGVIMETNWDEDEFITAIEEESFNEVEQETYNGYTVYDDGFDYIGVLDESGVYVIGDRGAVESAIDVHAGDADSLNGDLRDAYDNERDGLMKFAADMPEEDIIPDDPTAQFDTNVFNNVNTVTGVYYTDGNDVVFQTSMVAGNEADADDVYDVSDGALSMLRGTVENPELEDVVNAVSIEQNGNTVSVEYRSSADDIVEAIEESNQMAY